MLACRATMGLLFQDVVDCFYINFALPLGLEAFSDQMLPKQMKKVVVSIFRGAGAHGITMFSQQSQHNPVPQMLWDTSDAASSRAVDTLTFMPFQASCRAGHVIKKVYIFLSGKRLFPSKACLDGFRFSHLKEVE